MVYNKDDVKRPEDQHIRVVLTPSTVTTPRLLSVYFWLSESFLAYIVAAFPASVTTVIARGAARTKAQMPKRYIRGMHFFGHHHHAVVEEGEECVRV